MKIQGNKNYVSIFLKNTGATTKWVAPTPLAPSKSNDSSNPSPFEAGIMIYVAPYDSDVIRTGISDASILGVQNNSYSRIILDRNGSYGLADIGKTVCNAYKNTTKSGCLNLPMVTHSFQLFPTHGKK